MNYPIMSERKEEEEEEEEEPTKPKEPPKSRDVNNYMKIRTTWPSS
jgi:hypothetical protein